MAGEAEGAEGLLGELAVVGLAAVAPKWTGWFVCFREGDWTSQSDGWLVQIA